jgi:hypothetical protein
MVVNRIVTTTQNCFEILFIDDPLAGQASERRSTGFKGPAINTPLLFEGGELVKGTPCNVLE